MGNWSNTRGVILIGLEDRVMMEWDNTCELIDWRESKPI